VSGQTNSAMQMPRDICTQSLPFFDEPYPKTPVPMASLMDACMSCVSCASYVVPIIPPLFIQIQIHPVDTISQVPSAIDVPPYSPSCHTPLPKNERPWISRAISKPGMSSSSVEILTHTPVLSASRHNVCSSRLSRRRFRSRRRKPPR
jgi:hypothetical protein